MMKNRKKNLLALLAAFGVSGGSLAMAATLGVVSTESLGSATSVVASCDNDGVSLDYATEYDAANGAYEVSSVVVSGIDVSCNGQLIDLALSNQGGGQSVSATQGTIAGTSITLAIPADFAAELVDKVAIVIQSA